MSSGVVLELPGKATHSSDIEDEVCSFLLSTAIPVGDIRNGKWMALEGNRRNPGKSEEDMLARFPRHLTIGEGYTNRVF